MYKVFGPDGVPIFQSEMVMANYHAAEAGMPRPYSNEDIASAPSSRHAFITLEFQRFWKELEMHDRPDSTPPHGATSVGERSEGLFRF